MKKTILTLIVSILTLPVFVFGATTRTQSEINITNSEKFQENSYFFATKNNISGEYFGDLFVAGVENNFNGKVNNDLFVVGGKNNISGEIVGDLRVIAGEVVVNGKINGDLVIAGGNVTLLDGAEIKGDLILIGGKIYQNALLTNKSKIIGASVFLNNQINSPIEITAQKITAQSKTKINSPLTYYSPNQIIKDGGSEINNVVTYNQITNFKDTSLVKRTLINVLNFWILLKFITTLIISLILIYVFRFFTQKTVDLALNKFWKNCLYGLIFSLLAPLFLIILILSLIGLPIGFLAVMIYFVLIAVSVSIASIMIGVLIKKFVFKNEDSRVDFKVASIGLIVMTLISFVPVVGDLTKLVFDFVALGSVIVYLKTLIINK